MISPQFGLLKNALTIIEGFDKYMMDFYQNKKNVTSAILSHSLDAVKRTRLTLKVCHDLFIDHK